MTKEDALEFEPLPVRHETYTYVRASELDALRAENEKLRESVAWNTEQRAIQSREIERLRNGDGLEYSLSLTNAELKTENERLRAALVEISELDLEGDASLADAMAIADETLNP